MRNEYFSKNMKTIFSPTQINEMCQLVGITRDSLMDALRRVGPVALHVSRRRLWNSNVPASQFCYRVCEAVVRADRVPIGYQLFRKADGDGSHYFFMNPQTGKILDLTADQFVSTEGKPLGYDYTGASQRNLLPQISRGAEMVAEALGWNFK